MFFKNDDDFVMMAGTASGIGCVILFVLSIFISFVSDYAIHCFMGSLTLLFCCLVAMEVDTFKEWLLLSSLILLLGVWIIIILTP